MDEFEDSETREKHLINLTKLLTKVIKIFLVAERETELRIPVHEINATEPTLLYALDTHEFVIKDCGTVEALVAEAAKLCDHERNSLN